jgi:hypothetical protein
LQDLSALLKEQVASDFRASLQDVMLPRFDAVCREMFVQVNSAFDVGIERVCADLSQATASNFDVERRLARLDEVSLATVSWYFSVLIFCPCLVCR